MSQNKDYIGQIDAAERRFFNTEVTIEKRDDSNEPQLIEGMAALYNNRTKIGDWFEEEILPGAFDDVLNDDVRCLFNHNPNFPLARSKNGVGTLKLELTDQGLRYSYKTPDRTFARDLEDAIATGDVTGSSFAFRIKEEKWITRDNDVELRQIIKFERLYDVAPVTYPAYPDASVGKRSLDSFRTSNIEVKAEEVVSKNTKSVREAQLIINKNRCTR